MKSVELIQIIKTTNATIGSGKDQTSPIRVLTQYWAPDGTLLAEINPLAQTTTPERKALLKERIRQEFGTDAHVDRIMCEVEKSFA